MGAWGVGSFENDDAMDWIALLEESNDLSVIEDSLRTLLDTEEYIDLPIGANAIAAAEVVASALGKPGAGLPPEISAWVAKTTPGITAQLRELALEAMQRVQVDSEISELWEESDSLQEWNAAILDLESRLNAWN